MKHARDTIAAPAPGFSQSALYAAILRRMGLEAGLQPLGHAGDVLMAVRRMGPFGRIGLIPGGPCWRDGGDAGALALLPGLARAAGLRALIVNASRADEARGLRAAGFLPVMTGGFEAQIDLTQPGAARRAAMQGKWRNRLVAAERSGLEVRVARFHAGRHGWLIAAEEAQRRARDYRGLPPGMAAMAAQVEPGAVLVAEATEGDRAVAAMLFLIHGAAASYFIGHTTAEGRALAAHNLLLWRACNRLAERGIRRLDLGPVETEAQPGLARFKLGAGAVAVERGGSWLWTPWTAPLARLSRRGARGFPARSDPSCR